MNNQAVDMLSRVFAADPLKVAVMLPLPLASASVVLKAMVTLLSCTLPPALLARPPALPLGSFSWCRLVGAKPISASVGTPGAAAGSGASRPASGATSRGATSACCK